MKFNYASTLYQSPGLLGTHSEENRALVLKRLVLQSNSHQSSAHEPSPACHLFRQIKFIRTQPHSFVSVLSMVVFFATKTEQYICYRECMVGKPKIFTVQPFAQKCLQTAQTLNPSLTAPSLCSFSQKKKIICFNYCLCRHDSVISIPSHRHKRYFYNFSICPIEAMISYRYSSFHSCVKVRIDTQVRDRT